MSTTIVFSASELLDRAKAFEHARPHRKSSVGARPDLLPTVPHEARLMEIITPQELMARIKVSRGWINEKRRPRCTHPLPAVTNHPLRFNWYAIVAWLDEEARLDSERLRHKASLPVKRRTVRSISSRRSA